MTVLFDTCALISLLNEKATCHVSAEQCLRKLAEGKHRVMISPLTLAEYGVKGNLADVYAQPFRIPNFGVPHAEKAAKFRAVTCDAKKVERKEPHDRQFIATDTMILAQAAAEQVDCVLTNDTRTFTRTAEALKKAGEILPNVVLLNDDLLYHLGLTSQRNFDFEK